MDDNNSFFFNLKEAMDELWFHHNILFFQPAEINISTQSISYKFQASAHEKKIKKKAERLNIPINQPLYQLQLPTRVTGSDLAGRRRANMRKEGWSLTELENFEIEGFRDLGFVFSKEKLSPEMVKMLPGLRRFEGTEESLEDREVRRPYLSEVWLVDRSDSLMNLPTSQDSEDMKKHLKFWAHSVASSVHLD